MRDVKQAYFDLLAARRLRGVAEEVLNSNQRQLDQARGRYDVGFATKLDVTRSEVLVANAELDLVTARNAALVGEQTLRNAMGLTEPLDFDPVDVLEARPIEMDEQHALAIALENRSELASVRALRRAAEEDASSRWKEHLPDVGAAANYDWSGSSSLRNSWNMAALVNVPLFSGGLIDARVGEARANALSLSLRGAGAGAGRRARGAPRGARAGACARGDRRLRAGARPRRARTSSSPRGATRRGWAT